MPEPIIIVPYDTSWPRLFATLGHTLRAALSDVAVRIDHIGSTAVPGLDAKPILDVQVSVATLEPMASYGPALEDLGFRWQAANDDRTKRYFREPAGTRRTHIHVRRHGSWSEQFALLFRDFMRAHVAEAEAYAALKRDLAATHYDARAAYVAAKEPFIWGVMRRADTWAQGSGWLPGPSDA